MRLPQLAGARSDRGARHPARRAAAYSLAAVALAACGSTPEDTDGDGYADGVFAPNNVTVVTPVKPTGFVTGAVVDFTTGVPLPGASISLTGGGQLLTVTADAQGAFVFGPLPATRYALRVTVGGYDDALLTQVDIPAAAGDFPTENASVFVGPVGLLPTTGQLVVQLVSDRGVPVAGARVAVETAVRFYVDGTARSSSVRRGESDPTGRLALTNLPDVRALPPRLADHSALVVTIDPTDLDGDMVPDLRGRTVALTGAEVRAAARPFTIVLDADDPGAFQVIASTLPRFRTPALTTPSIVDSGTPIRVVFSRPLDRDTIVVDLRDESGEVAIPVTTVLGALGNSVELTPMSALAAGQEYNLALRVRTAPGLVPAGLDLAAPFFVRAEASQGLTAVGNFVDANGDGAWGTGNDFVRMVLSRPLGRVGAGFQAEVWLNLDLNGSMVVGDAQGELPMAGGAYPPALPVASAEPASGNAAPASGYTRFLTQLGLGLPVPRGAADGAVQFELRFDSNATDAEGRPPPNRITGVATLVNR
jgi:hypothetical protein